MHAHGQERVLRLPAGQGAALPGVAARASLTRMIWNLLEELQLQPQDLQQIVADIGPGSFVGLRQGLAVAQTLAWANRTPAAGLSSLRIMAAELLKTTDEVRIAVALPARVGIDFVGHRAADGTWQEAAIPLAQWPTWLQMNQPRILAIPQAEMTRPSVQMAREQGVEIVPAHPDAETLGQLFTARPKDDSVNFASLLPRYLAVSEAEVHAGIALPEAATPAVTG